MKDLVSENLLREVGPFYHITSQKAAERIRSEGLRPDAWDEDMYIRIEGVPGPFVCLSTRTYKCKFVDAIRSKFEGESTVLLEISTEAVIGARVGLDRTTDELLFLMRRFETNDPLQLVRAGAPLACYSLISPVYITEIDQFPPLR